MSQSTFSKVAVAIAAIIGIACCIAGGVLYQKFPDMARKKIEESLPLANGSESSKLWVESSVPLYWKVHFFNITNPDEVRENKKPILEEVGPFIFRLVKTKTDIDWSSETVFYKDHRKYLHEKGDLDTPITHFNILYMGIIENLLANPMLNRLPNKDVLIKNVLQGVFARKPSITLVETHTVYEILFGGFKSDLITDLSSRPEGATGMVQLISGLLVLEMKRKFPDRLFGLYYNKNDSAQHSYFVNTGKNDVQELGKIILYDNKEDLGNAWGNVNDTYCNMINGTDGTIYGPGVTKQQTPYAFAPEICRSAHFAYEKEVSIQDIVGYKFTLPIELLQDREQNPDNECFCRKDFCKTGTLKISATCPDADSGGIVFSLPHFYLGNESLLDTVDGLKPKKELHETYIIIEPNTGVVIGAAKRLQVNVHLRNLDLPLLKDAEERVMPIAWVEESAEIDDATAKAFRSKVTDSLYMYPKLFIGLAAVGGFFILLSAIVCIYKQKR